MLEGSVYMLEGSRYMLEGKKDLIVKRRVSQREATIPWVSCHYKVSR